MATHQNLTVWQKSIILIKDIYDLVEKSEGFNRDFGLKDQITRGAVSIASNIAEGNDRDTHQEFIRYLVIARGGLAEVQTQLYIAKEIRYIGSKSFEDIFAKSIEIQKMINALITSTKRKLVVK